MTVWIVVNDHVGADPEIIGVFSSELAAREYIRSARRAWVAYEYEVDALTACPK